MVDANTILHLHDTPSPWPSPGLHKTDGSASLHVVLMVLQDEA